ncbi:MAG: retropepsin-like aspartic protease [Terracidiphilus sp.]|jgi:predicted aspartyl protease
MSLFDQTGVAFALVLVGASLPAPVSIFQPSQVSVPAAVMETQHTTQMEVIHDKPYVKVMVNGKGPFRFVIDTGTGGQALVTPALADALGLPTAGLAHLNDPSGQGGKPAPMVLMDRLAVAGVEFRGVRAVRHVVNGEDGSCDGVLGFTLFRDYLLTLDYPHRRMTLGVGALTPDGEDSVLPIRMPDGVPIASMQIGKLRIDALMDSGGDGLSLPEGLVSRLKFAVDPVVFAAGQSFSTRFEIKAAKLAGDVRLGGYTFERPFVEIHAAFPLANFGGCPMQNFALTFDQKNLLMRMEASQKKFKLTATPTAIRLANAPDSGPPVPGLVPVG